MSVPANNGVPLKWDMMLKELQQHDPKAVLAGGAIRDLICGKSVRDLDFWITKWNSHKQMAQLLHRWGAFTNMTMGSQDEYATGNMGDENIVYQVWKIKPHRWWPERWQTTINIMWCNDWGDNALGLIEKYDFGLCMAAYDGKEIIRSRHFDHDYENKVFSLRRAVNPKRMKKSISRYNAKFKRKYGWPMELSGQARLDQMLAGFSRLGPQGESEI